MKSSSELFPVILMRADSYCGINDDVYLLKPNCAPDASVQLSVSHITVKDKVCNPDLPVVVLNHGSFTDRRFWLSRKGVGLARYLAESGYDVWLFEHRGHGFSPRNDDYIHNNVEQYIQDDIAAVSDFVLEQSGKKPIWIGHSLGALINVSALAYGSLNEQNCSGLALFGTQVSFRRWFYYVPLMSTVLSVITRFMKDISGEKMKLGPQNEPAGIAREMFARKGLFGRWMMRKQKIDLLERWSSEEQSLPIVLFSGVHDVSDPPKHGKRLVEAYGGTRKQFHELSVASGYQNNYGHVDMVVSKQAAQEVWPALERWLRDTFA